MKRVNIQDERVIFQKRRIGSDTFQIIYFGLIISILIQQFMFDAPFSQYAAEFILVMIAAIYIVGRNIIVGNNIFADSFKGQKIVVINSIVCGLTITAITTTLNIIDLGLEKMGGVNGIAITSSITLIFGMLFSFIGFETLYLINIKRQKQIDNNFNDIE